MLAGMLGIEVPRTFHLAYHYNSVGIVATCLPFWVPVVLRESGCMNCQPAEGYGFWGPKLPSGYAVSPTAPVIAYKLDFDYNTGLDISQNRVELFDFEQGQSMMRIVGLNLDLSLQDPDANQSFSRYPDCIDNHFIKAKIGKPCDLPQRRYRSRAYDEDYPTVLESASIFLDPLLSPDENVLANGFVGGNPGGKQTALIYLWDADTKKKKAILKSRGATLVHTMGFSPDNRLLASAIRDFETKYEGGAGHWLLGYDFDRTIWSTRVEVWNLKKKRRLRTFKDFSASIKALTFGPNNNELFVGGEDGLVHRFDIESGDLLATYTTPSDIDAILVSADGHHMLVYGFGESFGPCQEPKSTICARALVNQFC